MMKPWIAFLIGCVVALGFTRLNRSREERKVDEIITAIAAGTEPIDSLRSRLEDISEWEGKVVQALLACVATRVRNDAPQSSKTKVEPFSAARTPATPSLSPHSSDSTEVQIPSSVKSPIPSTSPSEGPTGSLSGTAVMALSAFDEKHFFCQMIKGTPSPAKADWENLFPPSRNPMGTTWGFGLAEMDAQKPEAFLAERVCEKPAFVPIPQRENQAFFRQLRRNVFQGNLSLTAPPRRRAPSIHFHFNELADATEKEYLLIYEQDGKQPDDLRENRTVHFDKQDATTHAWRWNRCSRAMSLLGESCPWHEAGDLEYKDIFYHEESHQLLGNVYCRNRKTKAWFLTGTFVLKISSMR